MHWSGPECVSCFRTWTGQGYIYLIMESNVLDLLQGPRHRFEVNTFSSTKLPNIDPWGILSLGYSAFLWPFSSSWSFSFHCRSIHYANSRTAAAILLWGCMVKSKCMWWVVFLLLRLQKNPQFSSQIKSNIGMEAKSHHKQPLKSLMKIILEPSVKCIRMQTQSEYIHGR